VGCSSSSSTSSESEGSSTGNSNPSSGEKIIKIGAPYPLTGPWAEGGQNSLNGMLLAVEEINNSGGIKALDGAKLEVISADTSADPNQSANATRRLIDDNVVALVGAYASALSLTATTEAEKAKVPMITQSFVDDLTERGYKYTFQIPPKSSSFGLNSIKYLSEMIEKNNLGITDVAFVANNDANSIQSIENGKKAAGDAGFNVVLEETFAPGITDATPVITRLRNEKPQLIFMAGVLQDQIMIIRSMRAQGIMTPVVGLGGGGFLGKGFAEALGEHSNNVFSLAAWNWDLKQDGVSDVNSRYTDKFNEPFIPQEAGESYIAVWLLKEAMEKAGSTDATKIRDQLATIDFSGKYGAMMVGNKVDFDEKGMNADVYPILIEWNNLLPHTVWPEKDKVMDAVFK
jgi:branched-chain amino acid transport system substrate-binding protein